MEKNSFSISDLYLTVSISDLFILFRKSRISDTLSLTAGICVSINSIFLLFVSICCFISLYEVIKANRFWLLNVINKEQVRKLKITTTILMYNNLSNLFPSSYNLSTILLTFKGDIDRLYHAFIFWTKQSISDNSSLRSCVPTLWWPVGSWAGHRAGLPHSQL